MAQFKARPRADSGYPFVPVKFFAQGVKVAPSLGMKKAHLMFRPTHGDSVAVQQAGERLHIKVCAGIPTCYDFDSYLPFVWKDNRAI